MSDTKLVKCNLMMIVVVGTRPVVVVVVVKSYDISDVSITILLVIMVCGRQITPHGNITTPLSPLLSSAAGSGLSAASQY